ncbi:hypothetical protein [Arthrobacter sp. IK3]|uniref:hypothetical protein n=1 Tax=Arthrobacter sp. IK3 TaxID=3448169 RepID=UPI003EE3C789
MGDTMLRNLAAAMTVLAAGAALTGCSALVGAPAEITGAESLRDAYVSAGGICEDWEQHNEGILSTESGRCGEEAALSFFDDMEDMKEQLSFFDLMEVTYLSGENWIINTSQFVDDIDAGEATAAKMGGTYTAGEK